jgi:hypothetical protein
MQLAKTPLEVARVFASSFVRFAVLCRRNSLEALAWCLLGGLLAGFLPLVLDRLTQRVGSDFWLFYESARYAWEHGVRDADSEFLHYLPSLDAAFMPLAWMPLRWAAVVWFAAMASAWLCLLAATYRYLLSDYDATQARRSILCAGLIVTPLFLDHLCIGAYHVLMVLLMVAGLGRISRSKQWSGSFFLGLAIWVKLLPLIAVGYLALKRKWLSAILAVAVAVSVDLALSLAAFGWQGAVDSHCVWVKGELLGSACQLLSDEQPIDSDRITNQSLMVVLRRVLTHMGHGTAADRDDTVNPGWVGSVYYGGARPNVSVANLTPDQARAVYTTTVLLLALAIAVYCRRPGCQTLPRQWAAEIALIVLATLWFSPLVWSYHPVAALPALAVIFVRAPQHSQLALWVAALWLVSLALMGVAAARAMGVTLWMNLLLGVFLVWSTRDQLPTLADEQTAESSPALPSPMARHS